VESNRRANVWRFGLYPEPCTLCSPLVVVPSLKLTNQPGAGFGHVAWFSHPADPLAFVFGTILPDQDASGRFPYGWEVEPD